LPSGQTETGISSGEDYLVRTAVAASASIALQEPAMKTHLSICNEADYLQAHLTFIVIKPRLGNRVFHDFKERVASLLKKWIMRRTG
jgi:hypothetical protein